jgi:hypothetical protein
MTFERLWTDEVLGEMRRLAAGGYRLLTAHREMLEGGWLPWEPSYTVFKTMASRNGISFGRCREEPGATRMVVPKSTLEVLEREAERRGVPATKLAARILKLVVRDGLIGAVLDDEVAAVEASLAAGPGRSAHQ